MGDRDEPLGGRAEAELRRLAYRDELTELPNRIAMADRIEAAVARSRREASCTALVFVDVDGMGRVNATLGHAAGDELLRLIAARLGGHLGVHVTVGRHGGGDEFLLLLDDLPGDPAAALAAVHEFGARVASSFRRPFTVERSTFEIADPPGRACSESTPIRITRCSSTPTRRCSPPSAGVAAGSWSSISRCSTRCSSEALLRWRDPDRGLLAPEAFLPFIEHAPLVEELGEWVFSELCRQLAEWDGRGFSPRISFNVPARQLRSPAFAEFAIATAERHGIDLAGVSAEITETSPISLDEVLPTLARLRDAGFSLSLDDFGTGYSSLSRLRTLPFSVLKIDRSFLAGVPGDGIAEELLRGIIALGATLGLGVIVEGVETREQERALLRLGARVAQGYHLGTPAPAVEIEARWGSAAAPVPEPPLGGAH